MKKFIINILNYYYHLLLLSFIINYHSHIIIILIIYYYFTCTSKFNLKDGGSNLEIWSRTKRIPGVIDDESTIFRRSVLLFNTWNFIPMEVNCNIPLGTETYNKNNHNNNFNMIDINNFQKNKIDPITNDNDIRNIHLKIMLLGNNKERRGRLERRIDLIGPLHIKNSLLDNKTPSYYKVYEE